MNQYRYLCSGVLQGWRVRVFSVQVNVIYGGCSLQIALPYHFVFALGPVDQRCPGDTLPYFTLQYLATLTSSVKAKEQHPHSANM